MINYLLDVILCGATVVIEIIGILAIGLLIQLFFYRVLKINLYKNTLKGLNKLEIYLEEKF